MPKITTEPRIRAYVPKPPPQRAYSPKPLDAGQRIDWSTDRYANTADRSGVIWSDGPYPRALWVRPDDSPGVTVLVMLPAPARAARGDCPAQAAPDDWASKVTRQIANIRRFDSVFTVTESVREVWHSYPRRTENVLSWHVDPGCPYAAGKPRDTETFQRYTVRDLVDVMLGRRHPHQSPNPLCRHCVYGITGYGEPFAVSEIRELAAV